jgi:phosphatidylglycerophosphate synthase
MVVVILSRELLVTTMRGALEGKGIDFSASWSGKAKMILQSLGIPLILALCWSAATSIPGADAEWSSSLLLEYPEKQIQEKNAIVAYGFAGQAISLNQILAWTITLVTAVSIVPYLARAMRATRVEAPDG